MRVAASTSHLTMLCSLNVGRLPSAHFSLGQPSSYLCR